MTYLKLLSASNQGGVSQIARQGRDSQASLRKVMTGSAK